ncbi:unnamed protein product [Moneuplotes crassus]|uniref:Aminopeptidase n=1 Tax=Euplotes crassus TaxID=5936 RepID=A0AAD1XX75_EUPCR|nr:unnamed protein product [Moneuplotes crassus]
MESLITTPQINLLKFIDDSKTSQIKINQHISSPLYREQAEKRSKMISDIFYDLLLVLPKGDYYCGRVVIYFVLNSEEDTIFLDYEFYSIQEIEVNGCNVPIDPDAADLNDLLNHKYFVEGSNCIRIKYVNKYKKTGIGLHKFIDPSDQKEYIYSQFAIYNAHKVFPCFDQPDLKARMGLTLVSPESHENLSNSQEIIQIKSKSSHEECEELLDNYNLGFAKDLFTGGYKISKFSNDQLMSSYLFCIISGPFDVHSREENIPGRDTKLKMRYLCRESLKPKANKIYEDVHEATLTGIYWYSDFFGTPFVWEKYDQIFCPEFKFGAMENAGAVTISETSIPLEEYTTNKCLSIQNIVLHELCHMWFGNLCTMKWWNDLWLNEAFATYMSYLCVDQNQSLSSKTPGIWIAFNKGKQSAINIDTLSNTHPIVKYTPHTDSAEDLLNSITYGKGPSFLKQLVKIIGIDLMKQTCSLYFKKFAWQNTTLEDFVSCLVESSEGITFEENFNLEKFCVDFLNSKGVNTIYAKINENEEEEEDSTCVSFIQKQGVHSSKVNHQLIDYCIISKNSQENSYDFNYYSLMLNDKRNYEQRVEHSECSVSTSFVIPNSGDHAYIQAIPDNFLIKELQNGLLSKIPDEVDRVIVWRGIVSLCSKMKLKPSALMNIIYENFPDEENLMIQDILGPCFFSCAFHYLPRARFESICKKLCLRYYRRILEIAQKFEEEPTKHYEELIKVLKSSMINYLYGNEQAQMATKWLQKGYITDEEDKIVEALNLTLSDRHKLLKEIFQYDSIDLKVKQELLQKELDVDKSDTAHRLKICCDSSIPDLENKAKVWEMIIHPWDYQLSIYDYKEYIRGFMAISQWELLKEYEDKYLEALPTFADCGDKEYMDTFVSEAYPKFLNDEDGYLQKLEEIYSRYRLKDPIKYDSFLRLVGGQQYEYIKGYRSIRNYEMQDSDSDGQEGAPQPCTGS